MSSVFSCFYKGEKICLYSVPNKIVLKIKITSAPTGLGKVVALHNVLLNDHS